MQGFGHALLCLPCWLVPVPREMSLELRRREKPMHDLKTLPPVCFKSVCCV